MVKREMVAVDGNEAAASVAHRVSEVIAIYPITPSSNMGEFSDEWSAYGKTNVWGSVPDVVEMQSEGGAAGAVHGALQGGALTTTFTASQGLLLMIPNMYKIAGELTPFTMHVAARTVAAHALSIFGDHSDVMACRQIGFAMLASGSVQEAHDLALVAHSATLAARVPFLHFFDGFRTSHEVRKIERLEDDDLRAMMSDELIAAHRKRALNPDAPVLRGTAQNPDVFFQAREACNSFYLACPEIVEKTMAKFAEMTGRSYKLFEYVGHPQAERVIVMMGSGAEVAHETVEHLVGRGEKVGVLKVRLFRPFSIKHFAAALPSTVRAIAVLDRCKEPGAIGEPLYLDVVTAIREAREAGLSPLSVDPLVIGGRYGLSSKEFHPGHVKAVLDELVRRQGPRNHFTVGIVDDVTHTSIEVDADFDIESDERVRSVFFGLGADGTVGANKNSIKIIGEETENDAQGYFVYDSKKSGAITISHLRFGPGPIRSSYLIRKASFVACHQFGFLEKYDMLEYAVPGGTFLINAPYGKDELWKHLPRKVQEQIVDKKLKVYAIDAYKVAEETGMGNRINSVMQTCFFAISGVLPREEAIAQIKKAIEKTYGKKGAEVVRRNFASVDATLENLHEIPVDRADQQRQDAPDGAGSRAGLREARAGRDHRGQGRPAARLGLPDRRHVADRHLAVGEARDRPRGPGLGREDLHPVQQVRVRLPARGDPREGLRRGRARQGAGHLQVLRLQGRRVQGEEVHDPGGPRGLHRLQPVRDGLPGQGQVEPEAQGDRHDADAAAARGRGGQLPVLPGPAGAQARGGQARPQGHAVPPAALRVLRRVLRLRRDALPQADDAALRRPRGDRERHRLLVDLRRQPADDALHRQRRRPRAGVVQLALRGQRRVRLRYAARLRRAQPAGDPPAQGPLRPGRRQPGEGAPRRRRWAARRVSPPSAGASSP